MAEVSNNYFKLFEDNKFRPKTSNIKNQSARRFLEDLQTRIDEHNEKEAQERKRKYELEQKRKREEQKRREEDKVRREKNKKIEEDRKKKILKLEEEAKAAEEKKYQQTLKDIKKNDDQYEKDYQNFKKDHSVSLGILDKIFNSTIGHITNNPIVSSAIQNNTEFTPSRFAFWLKNEIPGFLTNSTDMYVESLAGENSLNEIKKNGAEVYKQRNALRKSLEQIKQQQNLLVESAPRDKEGRPNLTPQQLDVYNKYNAQIKDIQNKLDGPDSEDARQLEQLYKAQYVLDNEKEYFPGQNYVRNALRRGWDMLSGMSIFSDENEHTKQLRDHVRKNRIEDLANRFDQIVDNTATQKSVNGRLQDFYTAYNSGDKNQVNAWKDQLLHNIQSGAATSFNYQNEGNQISAFDKRDQHTNEYINRINANTYNNTKKQNSALLFQQDVLQTFNECESAKKGDQLYNNINIFKHPGSLFGYLKYCYMPMLGSSNSSPEQAVSNIMTTAGTLAGLAGHEELAVASALLSAPGNIAGGEEENKGEVSQKRIDNLKNYLNNPKYANIKKDIMDDLRKQSIAYRKAAGFSDEWIKDRYFKEDGEDKLLLDYFLGITNNNSVAMRKGALESLRGLQAQYEADNMRTMSETILETTAMVAPWDRVLNKGVNKTLSSIDNKLSQKIERVATGSESNITDKFANGFRRRTVNDAWKSGKSIGGDIGEAMGFGTPGKIIGGTIGGSLNATTRALINASSKSEPIERWFLNRYQNLYDNLFKNRLGIEMMSKYGLRASKNTLAQMFSEGAEEGVQYLNSIEDYSKYGFGGMSIGDLIINDLKQGGRVFNAWGSLLGLTNSELKNDEEFWSNVQGGFILGGQNPNVNQIIQTGLGIKDAMNEYTSNRMILESGVLNREADKQNRAANVEFARQAMGGNRKAQSVLDALSDLQEQDSRRETPQFSQEDYDEKIEAAQGIINLTNNKNVRELLEAKGITYGSEEYAYAIADLYNLQQQQLANTKQRTEGVGNVRKEYNSKEVRKAIDDLVQGDIDSNPMTRNTLNQIKTEAGDEAVKEAIESLDEGKTLSKEEQDKIRKDAEDAAEQEAVSNYKQNVLQKTQLVNKLSALLELKAKHTKINDWFAGLTEKFGLKTKRPDVKTIVDNIQHQIDEVKQQLASIDDSVNVKQDGEHLLEYIQGLSGIVSANKDAIREQERANAMLLADAAVTNKYLSQYSYGLVLDKNGKVVYNQKEYNRQQSKKQRANKQLGNYLRATASKDEQLINKEREAYEAILKEEGEEFSQEDSSKDRYKQRIQAIMKTSDLNDRIDWVINDLCTGDAVTKMQEVFDAEDAANQTAIIEQTTNNPDTETIPGTTVKSEENPFEDNTVKQDSVKKEKRRKRYQEIVGKYKNKRKRSKERHEKRMKGMMRRLNSILPLIEIPLYTILRLAEDTAITFELIVDAIEAELPENLGDVNQYITEIKFAYVKKYKELQRKGVSYLNNLPTILDIRKYKSELVQKKVYVSPKINTNPNYNQLIQDLLNQDNSKIIPEISSYFDTFVNTESGVRIYSHYADINTTKFDENTNNTVNSIAKTLKDANTSDESFRKAIQRFVNPNCDFPIDLYVKYRNVNGVEQAIARRILQDDESESEGLHAAIITKNAIIKCLLGHRDEVVPFGPVGDWFENLMNYIENFKNDLEQAGYTIFDTQHTVYGLNEIGQDSCSEIDIMLLDQDGNIHAIDVFTGFLGAKAPRWFLEHYDGAGYTIQQLEESRLHQIEFILQNKFNLNVKTLSVLSVVYNDESLYCLGRIDVPKKQITNDNDPAKSIQHYEENVKEIIDSINSLIDEYNDYVDKVNAKGENFEKVNNVSVIKYDNVEDYKNYISKLQEINTDITSKLQDVKSKYEELIDEQMQDVYEDDYFIRPEEYDDIFYSSSKLTDACVELDTLMSMVPPFKITTEAEKNLCKKLLSQIIYAQDCLLEVLSNEEFTQTDVSKEQELIASAMEYITQHKDDFGSEAVHNVQQWWLTSISDSESNVNKYQFYVNSIKSWINVLRDHVMNDLDAVDKRIDIQNWYNAVLNKFFKQLLKNALSYVESKGNDTTYNILRQFINQGFDFINDFNMLYSLEPDTEFTEPPKNNKERLFRLPRRWRDKDGITEKHPLAIDAMAGYIHSRLLGWTPQNKIKDAWALVYSEISKNPNFINEAEFSLIKGSDGEPMILITYVDKNNLNDKYHGRREVKLGFITDLNAFEKDSLSEEDVKRIKHINRANTKFVKILKLYLEESEKTGDKILLDVSLNRGSVRYDTSPNAEIRNVSEFLFKGIGNQHDMYTIKLSQDDNLGIQEKFITKSNKEVNVVRTGFELSSNLHETNSRHDREKVKFSSGQLIYMFDAYGDGEKIPVSLVPKKIGETLAKKLLYLMRKYDDGVKTEQGFDIYELLNQLLYMYDDTKNYTEFNKISNLIRFVGAKQIKIGQTTYNLNTLGSEIITLLSNMMIHRDEYDLSENIHSSTKTNYNKCKEMFEADASLEKITLPTGITFYRDDFYHRNENGTIGTTWLGWLLRSGAIGTTAVDKSYRQLNIDKVYFESDKETENIVQGTIDAAILGNEDVLTINVGDLLATVSEELLVERSLDERAKFRNNCEDYFAKVLGENGRVFFSGEKSVPLDKQIPSGYAVGVCCSNVIMMSEYAPESVKYHEAFHKILELILEPKKREKLYQQYRDHMEDSSLTERDIAEALCDLYTDYVVNKEESKNLPFLSKVKSLFQRLMYLYGMTYKLGIKGTYNIWRLTRDINKGVYSNSVISKENIDRYNKLFGEGLFYTVRNSKTHELAEFQHIKDSSDITLIIEVVSFWMLQNMGVMKLNFQTPKFTIDGYSPTTMLSKQQIDSLCGRKKPENERTEFEKMFDELFKEEKELITVNGNSVYKTYYPNFAALSDKFTSYISTILSGYKSDVYDVNDEDDDDKAKKNNIDKFDKPRFEFSKLDGSESGVKLLFSTIPYLKFKDDNNIMMDSERNQFGLPQFMPTNEAFNIVVSEFHDVKDIPDFIYRLENKLNDRPIYKYLYQKIVKNSKGNALYQRCYKRDENGNIIDIDYDYESLFIQLFSAIKSLLIDFVIAKSETDRDDNKKVSVISTSRDKDSKSNIRLWSLFLLTGQTGVFKPVLENNKHVFKQGMQDVFKNTSEMFEQIRSGIQSSSLSFSVNGKTYNKTNPGSIRQLKEDIVNALNKIGIAITYDAFNYMLESEFKNSGAESVGRLFDPSSGKGISSFYYKIEGFTKKESELAKGYEGDGFVHMLATYQGIYDRITSQMSALGFEGKSYYMISQHNTISTISEEINSQDLLNSEYLQILNNFGYVITEDGQGSIIMKAVRNKDNQQLKCHTYIGFKTDNKLDDGSGYQEQPTVEDYMGKFAMLQKGWLIFPTLADKGTYQVIEGVNIPGINFVQKKQLDSNSWYTVLDPSTAPDVIYENGEWVIVPNRQVLKQMIEYANTERLAICQCMEDLGYKEDIPGYTKTGRKVIDKKDYVQNYHTKNKQGVEPNGTRFLQFTEIVVSKNGKFEIINLNDPTKSSVEMMLIAYDEFFSKSIEELMRIMAYTLNRQNKIEVEFAKSLGLVETKDIRMVKKDGSSVELANKNKKSLSNVKSKHLNHEQITILKNYFTQILRKKYGIPDGDIRINGIEELAESLAISAIFGDVTNRSIISAQECLRCFIGNQAQFKVTYDFKNKRIKDSTFDLQKRIGGLVSTGDDNITESIPGMPNTYTCAELDNYEVYSEMHEEMGELFVESCIREAYAIATNDWDKAFRAEISELYDSAPSTVVGKMKKAEEKAKKYSKSYAPNEKGEGSIDVADGSSFITDVMCENLLRARGAYNNKVKKAFEILRSEDTKYSWMEKAESFNDIYEAVNIVTTKYTAYGFRKHVRQNGSDPEVMCSDVAVAYYHKYALFPVFPCNATGNMSKIYQKMKKEGIDQLLMTSAVKLGNQGKIKYNGHSIDEPLNKYTVSMKFLRRQLNTDPEEGGESNVGTQMLKIGLQNLRLDRTNYIDSETGEERSGRWLLEQYMDAINQLSKLGEIKVRKRFFNEDGTLNVLKMSTYLQSQLSSRNANDNILQAIQLNQDGTDLNMCLGATTEQSWIESILISTINSEIIDVKTPGNSFVQKSIFALEKDDIQTDDDLSPQINNGNKLKMLNEDGSMDAVISIDYFEDIIPKGLSFNEAKLWLIDNEIIGPNARANTIGYRIPTQAQSSIHALRFVDVVAATKCTIILPKEFTKITGSDFDIDHLYLMSYNYSVKNKKASRTEGLNEEKQLQNKLISIMMTLLKDKQSMNSLYRSIDNDTELVKEGVADQLPGQETDNYKAFNFGALHEQVQRKNDYITGKTGIGPFALNVTNQVLTYLYGVRFNEEDEFVNTVGFGRLDRLEDFNDNAISSWLSAFINAHVDIVKDAYISKLDVNPYTYNMLNLLIRSGFGENALWFLSQPIIREMADASNKANSYYARDKKSGSTYKIKELMFEEIANKYGIDTREETISLYTNNPKYVSMRANNAYNVLHDVSGKLKQLVLNPKSISEQEKAEIQEQVFYAWKSMEKYSVALGELVQYTKIDTKKHGKSLIEQYVYYRHYKTLFEPPLDSKGKPKSLFDMDSLNRLAENSWIKYKTETAIGLPQQILGTQTFNANITFLDSVYSLAVELKGENPDVKFIKQLANQCLIAYKSKFFIDYAKNNLYKDIPEDKKDEEISKMFVGPRSMAVRLNITRNAILTNPKYARLKKNKLLNSLVPVTADEDVIVDGKKIERPRFITVQRNMDGNYDSNAMRESWLDLLNDPDKSVRKFARELIVYSYLTSGESSSWNSLYKYVPWQWSAGLVDPGWNFNEYVKMYLENPYAVDLFREELCQNNFFDYNFSTPVYKKEETVRVIDGERGKETTIETINYISSKDGTVLLMSPIIQITDPLISHDVHDDYPMYITVKKDGARGFNQGVYSQYKLEGFVKDKESREYPVYVKIKKKGYSTYTTSNGTFNIYEYSWDFKYEENSFDEQSNIQENINSFIDFIDSKTFSSYGEVFQNNKFFLNIVEHLSKHLQYAPEAPAKQQNVKESVIQTATQYYTREGVEQDKETLYIFTDNTDRTSGGQFYGEGWYKQKYGEGGYGTSQNPTSALIRGLENAAPISTMRYFYRNHQGMTHPRYNDDSEALWHDRDIEEFKRVFDDEIAQIKAMWDSGKYKRIVFPVGGGLLSKNTKLNQIRTPHIYNYMVSELKKLREHVENTNTTQNNDPVTSIQLIMLNTVGLDTPTAQATAKAMNSNSNPEFSPADNVLKEQLGGLTLKVAMASEHTDPAFHSKRVCDTIKEDLARPKGQRRYHMLQIMTKHDGLPLLDMLELDIPKSVHFSITSLGGTEWEPGVMKTDDLLDRIEDLINRGKLNPATTTVRIDPIIPGVTKKQDIEHIMQRMQKMGLKNVKVSVMDSYGYDELSKDRGVLSKMKKLGYNFDTFYDSYIARKTTTKTDRYGNVTVVQKAGEKYYKQDAKPQTMSAIYQAVDELAEKYGMYCTTCGEKPNTTYQYKRIRFAEGCLNATGVAAVLGVNKEDVEKQSKVGNQRPGKCNCLNNKSDVLAYDDSCASQCAYCYAKHSSDFAMKYYNPDGTLKESVYTRTTREQLKENTIQQHVSNEEVNVFAGTNENADLSNFAERPFKFANRLFKRVEQAFHIAKFEAIKMIVGYFCTLRVANRILKQCDEIIQKLNDSKSGETDKSIGLTRIKTRSADANKALDLFFGDEKINFVGPITDWNRLGIRMMKIFLLESFRQNPKALKRLLDTGDAKITHKQADKKWRVEFPKLLMEVREILKNENNVVDSNVSQTQQETIITYNLPGKEKQTYTIKGSHIYNSKEKEVFTQDSIHRNKIFANLAVSQGRAVVITHNGSKYVVNKKGVIMSVQTGKIMQWGDENGDRKAILQVAKQKFENVARLMKENKKGDSNENSKC